MIECYHLALSFEAGKPMTTKKQSEFNSFSKCLLVALMRNILLYV